MVEREQVKAHPGTNISEDDRKAIREQLIAARDELRGLGGPGNRQDALTITKLEEAVFWLDGGPAE